MSGIVITFHHIIELKMVYYHLSDNTSHVIWCTKEKPNYSKIHYLEVEFGEVYEMSGGFKAHA